MIWKRLLSRITDSLYIPEDLLPLRGRLVVHVSDTPSTFYRDLKGFIARVSPVALIHTGDVADDVKIGLCPRLLPWYVGKLAVLSAAIRSLPPERVFFVAGNHDHVPSMLVAFPGSSVFERGTTVRLDGLEIAMSHEITGLPVPPARFNLFGHDASRGDSDGPERFFLNGVLGVNCIDVATGDAYSIPYPSYVDRDRSRMRKCGL
jgi:hypothetical protein